ncbi:transporter substrate-binding domain-containing protein [Paraburkholderia polaris]|uniref:transporter substrate-binding domain-containing protein n=1 Tax=Paraburkholderia polaris TaxID=2728848 RepID=UPI0019817297|nr:transporter substrate-binding domain-containing protein [Paraburkholderia polaris]
MISKFTGYRHVSTLIAGTLISLGSGFAHAQAVDAQLRALVPAQYQQSGVKVAAFNDWPPDEFAQEGVLKGWSIDMATAMSARLGIKFEITGTSFDAILPGLVSKRFDAGFASFGVTPERLKVLDFVPQRKEGTAYAFPSSKSYSIVTEADLCGHSIAVLTGAWDLQYLKNVSENTCVAKKLPPIDLKQFTTENAAELAASSGRVELVAAGSAKLLYLAKQTGEFSVSKLTSNPVYNGIGIRTGDKLGVALAATLQAMIDDGSYAKIMTKWGVNKNGMIDKAVLVTEADPNPTRGPLTKGQP